MTREFGHTVYCITARPETKENKEEVYNTIGKLIGKDNCLFTDCMAKARYAAEKGVHIDIWIEDLPSNVDHNKKLFADFKDR
jgi:pyruvoyl-dependent arginine decarboxylase (PvlArgDC)